MRTIGKKRWGRKKASFDGCCNIKTSVCAECQDLLPNVFRSDSPPTATQAKANFSSLSIGAIVRNILLFVLRQII
jgi:hypothetical protein